MGSTQQTVTITLTQLEAGMLSLGAEAGTVDDAIDNLGWTTMEKAAFLRAVNKLDTAIDWQTFTRRKRS